MIAAVSRRGACPALSSPMRTGDGLLVRLNPVSGGLTPGQLAGLCNSAARHGNGIVEVTARGSFQIRGLTPASAPALAADVDALGIAVRAGVPVETGPLAGLDPAELADPRPLAEAIRRGVSQAALSMRLGPKVSVVVDGGGRIGLDAVAADVRLKALRPGVWKLSLAGTAETALPVAELNEKDAAATTLKVLGRIAAAGLAARARDVAVSLRRDLHRPPSVLPDISPSRGEIGRPQGFRQSSKLPISPLEGEMSGRTEGGRLNSDLLKLTDRRIALMISLPFGSATAGDLTRFAASAEAAGCGELRLAPARRLLVLCPDLTAADVLRTEAESLGFITDPADPRRSVSACPGAPACASGRFRTRPAALEIVQQARGLLDGSLHVSGCAKGCAHPAAAVLTLVGGEKGVGLVVKGTARDTPLAYSRPKALGGSLRRLARLAAAERRTDETLAACLSRIGADRLAAAFRQE